MGTRLYWDGLLASGLRLDRGWSWSSDGLQACRPGPLDGYAGLRNRLLAGGALPDAGLASSGFGRGSVFTGGHGGALERGNVFDGDWVEVLLLGAVAAEEAGQEAGAGGCFGLVNFGGLLGAHGLGFSLALGALFTPVAPAIVPGDDMDPALLDALLDGPDADCGGEVKAGGGKDAGNEPGALDVHVPDEYL